MPGASGVLPCTVLVDALRLLADDGPAADLERAAAALAGSDPETAALVLRVRATIEAGRRREAELAALVDTARDLAAESDPGLVLDAIVRWARALSGTDVVYLTLDDPDAHHDRVVAAGGSVVRGLVDQPYGSREFAVADPEGNVWSFGTYRPARPLD